VANCSASIGSQNGWVGHGLEGLCNPIGGAGNFRLITAKFQPISEGEGGMKMGPTSCGTGTFQKRVRTLKIPVLPQNVEPKHEA
jgi:hypothetical protein